MADAQEVPSSLSWPGRRKRRRAIAFVDDKSARLVTYSKRRPGLFKKATETCLLTGCSVAIVGFSPTGRPFSFSSHPTLISSMADFLDSFPARDIIDAAADVLTLPPSEEIMELASEVTELERRLAAEKSAARSSPKLEELRAAKRRVEGTRLAVLARLDELKNVGRPPAPQDASSSC